MFDDDAPPTKRLKLYIPKKRRSNMRFANKENTRPIPVKMISPNQDVRKRKVPQRRVVSNLSDLNSHIIIEVLDYLSIEDLCNLADISREMRKMAENAFIRRARNGLNFHRDVAIDFELLKRVFMKFGHLISMITIAAQR